MLCATLPRVKVRLLWLAAVPAALASPVAAQPDAEVVDPWASQRPNPARGPRDEMPYPWRHPGPLPRSLDGTAVEVVNPWRSSALPDIPRGTVDVVDPWARNRGRWGRR